jgi:hypothetical protein
MQRMLFHFIWEKVLPEGYKNSFQDKITNNSKDGGL